MQVTSVGHAGFHIQTEAGSILCDPWVNPAYFASWFPFPDNTQLDWDTLGNCDYLYVSHLHKDHFDPENLSKHVNKDATVLLPDYPVPDLKRELETLGFHKFFETEDSVKHTVTGPKGDLDIMIIALRAPADGPIGDSGLVVSDGETTCFNMNDARPVDMDVLHDAVRQDRHPPAAVLGRHLVPDGLRHPHQDEGQLRQAEASARHGPLPQLHRAGRGHLGGAVGRTAGVPRRRPALPQRRPRRRGQHLPRPDHVPRADADPRQRRRHADDPGLDRGPAGRRADAHAPDPGRRGRQDLLRTRPRTSRTWRSAWRRSSPPRRPRGPRPRASRCWRRSRRSSSRS